MSTLPVSLAPRHGESIESWLEHLADANGLTTAQLLTHLRHAGVGTRYLTLAPSPRTVHALAALARVTDEAVSASTLAAFDGTALNLSGLDPADRHSYRQVAARGWTPARGTQICPACLAETGTWQSTWRLLLVTACTRHQNLLVTVCPSCRRPFRDQRHSHLRRVGPALVCGNPLGAGPTTQCQHDLATISSTPAAHDVLALQSRVDTALVGRPVQVLGEPAMPTAYLADLRQPDHPPAPPGQPSRRGPPRALGARPSRNHRKPDLSTRTPMGAAATRRPQRARSGPGHRRHHPGRRRPRHRGGGVDAMDRVHPDHERRTPRLARRPHRHDPDPHKACDGRAGTAPAPVPSPRHAGEADGRRHPRHPPSYPRVAVPAALGASRCLQ